MAAETQLQLQEQQRFFDLFDSYWFFNKTQNPCSKIQQSIDETVKICGTPGSGSGSGSISKRALKEKGEVPTYIEEKWYKSGRCGTLTETTVSDQILDFLVVPTINVRSYSDQLFMTSKQRSSFISDSLSSVLNETEEKETVLLPIAECKKPVVKENNRRKKRVYSKSLSELEFEELKGFMDLGFVFSEKDKETSLVSIIPGLQRLGKDDDYDDDKEQVSASRPYLSEAWENNKGTSCGPHMIRIPAIGNEVEINKNQLRFWAHSVASIVK